MVSKKKSGSKNPDRKPAAPGKAGAPKGAPTLADLRRIARSIVTATSVMDEKRMAALYAEGVESEEIAAGSKPTHGIEAARKKGETWSQRISKAHWHARNLWCDGQTIVIEWEAQLSLKPKGRKSFHREIAIHEVRNGKIVRERFYYDPASLGSATHA